MDAPPPGPLRAVVELLAGVLAGFSLFAGLLAVLGLYGVLAYAARQQRRSLAIRRALGADGARVRRLFVREGMAVVALGLVMGLPLSWALGRLLQARLHGVGVLDPAAHLSATLVLLVTASLAVWVPAARAARSEPMSVLREE